MTDETAERHAHREICSVCQHESAVGFSVPDDVWELAVHASQRTDIFCLGCFTRAADARLVKWDRHIMFYPVSLVTHLQLEGLWGGRD